MALNVIKVKDKDKILDICEDLIYCENCDNEFTEEIFEVIDQLGKVFYLCQYCASMVENNIDGQY